MRADQKGSFRMKLYNRFNFDKKILSMLDNLDNIPRTQTDPLPGVGGRLFIITKTQKNAILNICNIIDALKPEEYNTYPDKEKFFWACICNNADRVLNNCVVYER
jgi:hypothetical protein